MKSLVLYSKFSTSDIIDLKDKPKQIDKNEVELHINLWKIKNGIVRIKPNLVFDFGIKFDSTISELCLFLPFRIPKKHGYKDLGKCLSSNRNLLNAVFNEDMICQSANNHCFSKVSVNDIESGTDSKDKDFYIYHLGEDNISVVNYIEDSEIKGTYLTINIHGNPSNNDNVKNVEKYYVRFRIYVKDIKEIVQTEILSNDLLQAAFSRMDLFDIRLNERREIPSKVEEKMKKDNFKLCSFKKLHFFYIVDTHESIKNGIDIRKDSRLLENDQWIEYEPQSNIEGINYIAHHWKKKEDKVFSHFSLFFTSIYPKLSLVRLLAYFSIIVLLGWCGSMLSFPGNDLFPLDIHSNWISFSIVLIIFLFVVVYILKSNIVILWIKFRRKL